MNGEHFRACFLVLRRWSLVVSSLLSLLPTLSFASEGPSEKRIALVIGNSAYPAAPLANPVNDANAVAKKLGELGFDVMLRSNTGQREMTRALSEFGERITPGAVALFYYAGHGIQSRGKNYLIPVDADIKSETAVSSEAVDVERVLDQLGAARLSMVVLDACRNNPFERRFRSGAGRGLAQIDAPAGSLIAYATAPGKVAWDGDGRHGPYTEALLRAIDTPGLRVEDVFKQVRIEVLKVTRNQQIPWESSSLTGDFLFRPAAVAQDPVRAQAERDAAALREQLMALSSEVAKLRQAQSAGPAAPASTEQKKAEQEAADSRKQLALLNAELARIPAGSSPPRFVDEWKKQLAKVQKSRGNLTFSSAMAQLLEIKSAEELATLRSFESEINRRAYQNAFAIGVDPTGHIVWGGAYSWRNGADAAETAVDLCARRGTRNCASVVENGRFADAAFLTAMSMLASESIDNVRTALIDSLRRPVTTSSFAGGFAQSAPSFGYLPSIR